MARRPKTPDPASSERAARMLARLRSDGLKLTPQRLALVRELADDLTHPTAQELFERLRLSLPTMSFATVYNTLGSLTAAGLCASRQLAAGPARFDPNTSPHHHAVCDACGRVFDVPSQARPTTGDQAQRAVPGFVVRSVERVYRGLCGPCSATPRGAPPS